MAKMMLDAYVTRSCQSEEYADEGTLQHFVSCKEPSG
ncbi:hypothetical protein C5167_012734 [Papaver somniferum]|uniref:Uncharacterized protein n=1 Tax=Papaver somniferum TaxID=3469 RepID=A0A4Y7J2L4_PAPSO|nr:hypothetical protein C5167_012734 [Papaver somniferum]